MAVVLAWLNARVVDPVLQVIQRGAEPKQLAFSAALGLTIGIFPICGTTVIIGGIAVAMLGARCNAVTLMVLNLAATPLELSFWESFPRKLPSPSFSQKLIFKICLDFQISLSNISLDSKTNLGVELLGEAGGGQLLEEALLEAEKKWPNRIFTRMRSTERYRL